MRCRAQRTTARNRRHFHFLKMACPGNVCGFPHTNALYNYSQRHQAHRRSRYGRTIPGMPPRVSPVWSYPLYAQSLPVPLRSRSDAPHLAYPGHTDALLQAYWHRCFRSWFQIAGGNMDHLGSQSHFRCSTSRYSDGCGHGAPCPLNRAHATLGNPLHNPHASADRRCVR